MRETTIAEYPVQTVKAHGPSTGSTVALAYLELAEQIVLLGRQVLLDLMVQLVVDRHQRANRIRRNRQLSGGAAAAGLSTAAADVLLVLSNGRGSGGQQLLVVDGLIAAQLLLLLLLQLLQLHLAADLLGLLSDNAQLLAGHRSGRGSRCVCALRPLAGPAHLAVGVHADQAGVLGEIAA